LIVHTIKHHGMHGIDEVCVFRMCFKRIFDEDYWPQIYDHFLSVEKHKWLFAGELKVLLLFWLFIPLNTMACMVLMRCVFSKVVVKAYSMRTVAHKDITTF
jgi:hypothetical protein